MAHSFTSIHHSLERLQEAEYFLCRLITTNGLYFAFDLNAFLSASRSVTFVLQRELSDVPAFQSWYQRRSGEMKSDSEMEFFKNLRNISQKRGPVAYVGGARYGGGYSARFLRSEAQIPPRLVERDIAEACAEHLKKLASLLLGCYEALPFHCCMAGALSVEGMDALGYTLEDVETALGLPKGWTDVGGNEIPLDARLNLLKREIEPLDLGELDRLAAGKFQHDGVPLSIQRDGGPEFLDYIANKVNNDPNLLNNGRALFIGAILERIKETDPDQET